MNGKTIDEWSDMFSLPVIRDTSELSVNQIEILLQQFFNVNELHGTTYAKISLICRQLESAHLVNIINTREIIEQEFELNNKRPPGSDKLDKLAETRCIDSFIKKERAFSLLEFWKMQGYKIKNAGERLTSLSIIKHH